MKEGGADIRVIEGTPFQGDMIDMRGDMLHAAREITEAFDRDEMAAFVMIALRHDGNDTGAYRMADDCHIPRMLMPSFISELVRANMIDLPLAEQTFGEMFEWVE